MSPEAMVNLVVGVAGVNLVGMGLGIFKIGRMAGNYEQKESVIESKIADLKENFNELKQSISAFQHQQLAITEINVTLRNLQEKIDRVHTRQHELSQPLTVAMGSIEMFKGDMERMNKSLEGLRTDLLDKLMDAIRSARQESGKT